MRIVGTNMLRPAVLLAVLILMTVVLTSLAEARCRWVWRGVNSYYVCDEDDVRARSRATICDFRSERGPKGGTRTRTFVCRPDGSVWKEIVVLPHSVVVKVFKHDGTLLAKKKIPTDMGTAAVQPRWKARKFHMSMLGATVDGRIERLGSKLRGVARVHHTLGGTDTYHFKGTVRGNRIAVSHSSGHRFKGKMNPDGLLVGILTTRTGLSIPIRVPFWLP